MTLLKSWVASANAADTPFPLNNLPYGVFSLNGAAPVCGVAIGDQILNLGALEAAGLISPGPFNRPNWNGFMAKGQAAWRALREKLTSWLAEGSADADQLSAYLVPQSDAQLHLPISVAEYTDFYAGRNHAFNVGTMFRGPENALPPNWLHIPIGYNGRASTVVVSGTCIRRPNGQLKAPDAEAPHFGPCQRLDIELELGAIVGTGNEMGQPVSVDEADQMIFGYVLLNDWSARDVQAWEYQPLGPFQAKAFATSISPWIVSAAALAPFRCPTPAREKPLLDYLDEGDQPRLFDIELSIGMVPAGSDTETIISQTNYNEMYYSAAQQLAHHASSGCQMNTGDLLGSGTISGADKSAYGSLLEITWGGKEPLELKDGAIRRFIEDGDSLRLYGAARTDNYQIGFGVCEGTILPAHPLKKDR